MNWSWKDETNNIQGHREGLDIFKKFISSKPGIASVNYLTITDAKLLHLINLRELSSAMKIIAFLQFVLEFKCSNIFTHLKTLLHDFLNVSNLFR